MTKNVVMVLNNERCIFAGEEDAVSFLRRQKISMSRVRKNDHIWYVDANYLPTFRVYFYDRNCRIRSRSVIAQNKNEAEGKVRSQMMKANNYNGVSHTREER